MSCTSLMTINDWLETVVMPSAASPSSAKARSTSFRAKDESFNRTCPICQEDEDGVSPRSAKTSPIVSRRSSPRLGDARWIQYPCHPSHCAHLQCAKLWMESKLGRSDTKTYMHPACPVCRSTTESVLVQSQAHVLLESEADLFARRHFRQLEHQPIARSSASSDGLDLSLNPANKLHLSVTIEPTKLESSTHVAPIAEPSAAPIVEEKKVVDAEAQLGVVTPESLLLETAKKMIALGCQTHAALNQQSKDALFLFAMAELTKMR